MISKYFLLFSFLLTCFLFSCKKNNNTASPLSVVGTWNLQQQHTIFYIDGSMKLDTIYSANALTYGTAQFNKNGTFSSVSFFIPKVPWNVGSFNNESGTYNISDNGLSISPGITGWFNYVTGYTVPPTFVSNTVEVKALTASTLTLHIDYAFSFASNSVSNTYRMVSDFYYTK